MQVTEYRRLADLPSLDLPFQPYIEGPGIKFALDHVSLFLEGRRLGVVTRRSFVDLSSARSVISGATCCKGGLAMAA